MTALVIGLIMLLPPLGIGLTTWLCEKQVARAVPPPIRGTAKERATGHWNWDLGFGPEYGKDS